MSNRFSFSPAPPHLCHHPTPKTLRFVMVSGIPHDNKAGANFVSISASVPPSPRCHKLVVIGMMDEEEGHRVNNYLTSNWKGSDDHQMLVNTPFENTGKPETRYYGCSLHVSFREFGCGRVRFRALNKSLELLNSPSFAPSFSTPCPLAPRHGPPNTVCANL